MYDRDMENSEGRNTFIYMYIHVVLLDILMRDEEGRKKQARSNKQQSKVTQHNQGSHFQRKMSCLGLDYTKKHMN